MFAEKMGARVGDDSVGFRGKSSRNGVFLVNTYDDLLEMRDGGKWSRIIEG